MLPSSPPSIPWCDFTGFQRQNQGWWAVSGLSWEHSLWCHSSDMHLGQEQSPIRNRDRFPVEEVLGEPQLFQGTLWASEPGATPVTPQPNPLPTPHGVGVGILDRGSIPEPHPHPLTGEFGRGGSASEHVPIPSQHSVQALFGRGHTEPSGAMHPYLACPSLHWPLSSPHGSCHV